MQLRGAYGPEEEEDANGMRTAWLGLTDPSRNRGKQALRMQLSTRLEHPSHAGCSHILQLLILSDFELVALEMFASDRTAQLLTKTLTHRFDGLKLGP
jgi:hypothetical protein